VPSGDLLMRRWSNRLKGNGICGVPAATLIAASGKPQQPQQLLTKLAPASSVPPLTSTAGGCIAHPS
jgi:hypothetical protein